ncbi:MAG: hypothetical protein JWO25_1426 [Alphaproteobacteria bacterium]|nr:hypothetical protein [Alphaproteobacteria bacterium]MDB5720327.1 hypothetical protein [Alphaproteobacteria bacterium]
MIRYRHLFRALVVAGAGLFLLHAIHSMRAQACPLDPFAPADIYPCGSDL